MVSKLAHCPRVAQPRAGTRLCLGKDTQKGCCHGRGDDMGVPVKRGWLPCQQGAGASAGLWLGIVPEQVLTDAGSHERVMLGTVLCPVQGWAPTGGRLAAPCHAVLETQPKTFLCLSLHRSTRALRATQRFVLSILELLCFMRGKKQPFTMEQNAPAEA